MEECIWPILFESLIFEVVASSSEGGITEINLGFTIAHWKHDGPDEILDKNI